MCVCVCVCTRTRVCVFSHQCIFASTYIHTRTHIFSRLLCFPFSLDLFEFNMYENVLGSLSPPLSLSLYIYIYSEVHRTPHQQLMLQMGDTINGGLCNTSLIVLDQEYQLRHWKRCWTLSTRLCFVTITTNIRNLE